MNTSGLDFRTNKKTSDCASLLEVVWFRHQRCPSLTPSKFVDIKKSPGYPYFLNILT